jgi:hypothetical protein
MGTFHFKIRKINWRRPVLPSFHLVKIMLAAGGPISIMGNIRIPSIFGIAWLLNIFGAIMANAPSHEIKKAHMK